MEQDGHAIIILAFRDHKNIFLGHGGDNWVQEEVTEFLVWDVVIQNSPGTTYYDPTMTRLLKWDSIQGAIRAA